MACECGALCSYCMKPPENITGRNLNSVRPSENWNAVFVFCIEFTGKRFCIDWLSLGQSEREIRNNRTNYF